MTDKLIDLLKEAREVLEYYKNSALKEDVVYEYPRNNNGSYTIFDTEAIINAFQGVKPIPKCYLKYDKETAEQMIKKIDEVL